MMMKLDITHFMVQCNIFVAVHFISSVALTTSRESNAVHSPEVDAGTAWFY
jgi:hypothetical protein